MAKKESAIQIAPEWNPKQIEIWKYLLDNETNEIVQGVELKSMSGCFI